MTMDSEMFAARRDALRRLVKATADRLDAAVALDQQASTTQTRMRLAHSKDVLERASEALAALEESGIR